MLTISEEQFADMQDGQAWWDSPSILIIRNGKNYDDYIDAAAEIAQVSRFRIAYNHLAFNGASSLVSVADLLLNPWYKVIVPQPVLPPHKKSIYEAIQPLPDDGCIEWLNLDEQAVADKLPNGWTSGTGYTYGITPYVEQTFYRPSANLPLDKYVVQLGYYILHPWLKRPINHSELNAILHCDFVSWMQSWVDTLVVGEEMIRYVCDLDFTKGPTVANPRFTRPEFAWKG